MSKNIAENKNPQRCNAEEVKEAIRSYLNTDFSYKNLQNKKERKIYQSGFWSGTQFIEQFKNQREREFKAVDSNDH